MGAWYPRVYYRPADTPIVFGNIPAAANILDGWTEIKDVEYGLKSSIDPGLMKRMAQGYQKVLTEKISLEFSALFVDKARYERFRDELLNTDVDIMLYDPEAPKMDTVIVSYWRVNLEMSSDLSSPDGYKLIFKMGDVSKQVGVGVSVYDNAGGPLSPVVISGRVIDINAGDPVADAVVTLTLDGKDVVDSATDEDGVYLMMVRLPHPATGFLAVTKAGMSFNRVSVVIPTQNTELIVDIVEADI